MNGTPIGQECRPIQGLNPLPIDVLMRGDSNLGTANGLDTGFSAIGRNDRLPLIKATVLVKGKSSGPRLGTNSDHRPLQDDRPSARKRSMQEL